MQAGFRAFRVHCSKCHRLNGEGGTIGPELNLGANPVEYRSREWLHGWIDDPAGTRPGSAAPQAPNRTSHRRWLVSTFPAATAAG